MFRVFRTGAHTIASTVSVVLLVVASQLLLTIPSARAIGLSIQVSGNTLIDGSGQVITLHGVNRSGTEFRCFENPGGFFDGPSDSLSVQAIKNWANVNVVRLPLNEDCWLGEKAGLNPAFVGANYRSAISSYVNLLTNNGLYTILDLHWAASGTELANFGKTPEFPNGRTPYPMPNEQWSPAFWSSVATAFKDNLAVIFDLYNEPYPDNNQDTPAAWTCLKNGGTCNGMSFQAAGMDRLVTAVRSTGATNVIMVPGVGFAKMMSQWLSYKPNDSQIVAKNHRYRIGACNDVNCWNSEYLPIAQQVPLVTGEMGEDEHDVTCVHAFIDEYMAWADPNRVGYLAWTWNTWTGYCMALITSYDGTPSAYGEHYKNHLAPLFTDDFNDGNANGWSLTPPSYWSVVSGELRASGATVGSWSQETAGVLLPSGAKEFEARIAAPATTPSEHGIVASTADMQYQILFMVDQANNLRWSTVTGGVWSGFWVTVGSIDRTALHTYTVRRDGGAVFSVLADGAVKASGIVVDPPSVWVNGIPGGILFTQAELSGQTLNTRFDDVVVRK
jgi:hypothetical protein